MAVTAIYPERTLSGLDAAWRTVGCAEALLRALKDDRLPSDSHVVVALKAAVDEANSLRVVGPVGRPFDWEDDPEMGFSDDV